MTLATAQKAKELTCASLEAADDRDIILMLAKLSTLVARRAESDDENAMQLSAYVERLRAYPADIVMAALDDWPDRSKFWPAWFELKEIMDPAHAARLALLRSIEQRALPKPDEREAMLAELDKSDPQRAAMLRKFRVVR